MDSRSVSSQPGAAKRQNGEREALEAPCCKRPCRQSPLTSPGDDDGKGEEEHAGADVEAVPHDIIALFSPNRIEKAFQEIEVLSWHKADHGGSDESQLFQKHARHHANERAPGENEQPNAQRGVCTVSACVPRLRQHVLPQSKGFMWGGWKGNLWWVEGEASFLLCEMRRGKADAREGGWLAQV